MDVETICRTGTLTTAESSRPTQKNQKDATPGIMMDHPSRVSKKTEEEESRATQEAAQACLIQGMFEARAIKEWVDKWHELVPGILESSSEDLERERNDLSPIQTSTTSTETSVVETLSVALK